MKFLDPINLLNKSSAPSGPAAGDAYYDTTLDAIGFYNGSQWNYVQSKNYLLQAYAQLGSSVIAECLTGPFHQCGTAAALASQAMRFIPVWLPRAATITGVKFGMNVQGVYTSSDYNGVGLYTYSAGTYTKVAASTDDGNLWKAAANTLVTKAFSATYAASAGLLFVAMLYCSSAQTTAPSLSALPTGPSGLDGFDFTNSAKLFGTATSKTSLPATQAAASTVSTIPRIYAALY